MLLQNALFLFIPDIYIRGWTLGSLFIFFQKNELPDIEDV